MRIRKAIAAFVATLGLAGSFELAHAQGSQQERQLVRRGEGRADLWFYFQENDPSGNHLLQPQLRLQRPWHLPEGWKINWRFDFPLKYTDEVGAANPSGHWKAGFGDMSGQVSVTTPDLLVSDEQRGLNFNVGFRLVVPTGKRSPFGSSQWKAAPQIGLGYDRKIAEGYAFEIAPLVRYFRGFSETHSGVTTTRAYDVYPTITLYLPDQWAITMWDENPMTYNARTNAWFVPIDIMVVKRFGKYFQAGVGGAVRVINDDPSYKYMLYGRVSTFF